MKIYIYYSLFFISIFSIVSCKKPKISDIEEDKKEILDADYTLNFNVNSIKDLDVEEINLYASSKTQKAEENKNIDKSVDSNPKKISINKYVSAKSVDALITINNENLFNSSHSDSSSSNPNNKLHKIASGVKLNNGIKYRVILYKTDNSGNPTEYLTESIGTIGSPLAIPVYRNKTYRWYAITYNSTVAPPFNSTTGKVNVRASRSTDVSNRQDFAYETGLITTSNEFQGQNKLPVNIILKRKTAKIRIEINSRGLFAPITAGGINFNSTSNLGMLQGDFNILNGQYDVLSNFAISVPYDSLINNTDSVPARWKKYYDFLTPVNNTSLSLHPQLNNLAVTSNRIIDNEPNTFTSRVRVFNSPSFPIPSFVAEQAKFYIVGIKLIESAIDRGGVKWARANLFYDSSIPYNQYRFRYDNASIENINGGVSNFRTTDFWLGGLTPTDNAALTNTALPDPCTLVYPQGTWKLPSSANYTSLMDSDGYARNAQYRNAGWYITWDNIGSATGHPHGHLIFTANGYFIGTTLNDNPYNTNDPVAWFRTSSRYAVGSTYYPVYFQLTRTATSGYLVYVPGTTQRSTQIRCIRTS